MPVLVGSDTTDTIVLTDEEYETLRNALVLTRTENSEAHAIAFALRALEKRPELVNEVGLLGSFLYYLMSELPGESVALFCQQGEKPILLDIYEDGREKWDAIAALLNVLDARDWFAEFLKKQLKQHQKGMVYITPFALLSPLADSMKAFEAQLDSALEVAKRYPRYFEQKAEERREVANA